jgi:VWFA-related protein
MVLRTRPRTVVLIAILACSINLSAKTKDKSAGSEVKFTSRAEMVLVPTLVTDKSGAHVSGLKQEDFTVLENGVPQRITSQTQGWARPANPNEFTNSVTGGAGLRITVIVLDFINTAIFDQVAARKALLKYLGQTVDRREPTAVYTLTRSGIHVIHDFTTDPAILAAALHKVNGEPFQMVDNEELVEASTGTASPEGAAGAVPGAVQTEASRFQAMIEDSELNFQAFQRRLAITYTLQAMQQIAHALAGFPVRKSLIWASGGFPFSVDQNFMTLAPAGRESLVDLLPMYERTWQMLNNAQVALYPIDVKGLQQVTTPAVSVNNPGRNYAQYMMLSHIDTEATFLAFAAMTGGRAYMDNNDLVKGFREAARDSSQYYLIGYYLNRGAAKSGWRRLNVKVGREHVQVRARSGFFVTSETEQEEASRSNDIEAALKSPLDYTSLGLVARWTGILAGRIPGTKQVTYKLHVVADPALVDDADQNHLLIEFVIQAETVDGKKVDHPLGKKIDGHLTAENVAEIRHRGIDYSSILDLAPGEYAVRFVVHDDLSGRIGSVVAPVTVQ